MFAFANCHVSHLISCMGIRRRIPLSEGNIWNAINAFIHYFSLKKNDFSLKKNDFFQREIVNKCINGIP